MNDTLTGPRRPSPTTQKTAERAGASDPTRKEARNGDDSERPPSYLFELLAYDELAQEESGSIGLSPPDGYHLEGWKAADEAVVVCWERDDV